MAISAHAEDAVDPTPTTRIVGVSSNEPAAGDWAITGPLTVELRAKRLGQGSGRVYTITVESVDAAGNSSSSTVTVVVPHNQ